MTSATGTAVPPVLKTVTVKASIEHAFKVFTDGIDTWWPKSHHIGKEPLEKTVIEPRLGGRCYGLCIDGSECDWGQILAWEPPGRFVMAWQITTDWQYQPDLTQSSEVEVRFTPIGEEVTRVDLEHRHFERHGVGGAQTRTAVDSPDGWGSLLVLFAKTASDATAPQADQPGGSVATTSGVAGPLALIFSLNDVAIPRSLEGLTDAQLWQRPFDTNNPMLWIVGHAISTRVRLLRLLGQSVETGWGDLFARGAELSDESRYPSRAEILRVHADVGGRLQTAIRSLSMDDLGRPATGPQLPGAKTRGDQIAFLAMHDSYHVGQLGYIRKALGLSSLVG